MKPLRPRTPLAILFVTRRPAGTPGRDDRLSPTLFFNTYAAAHAPVLRVKSGDHIVTAVVDDMGVDGRGQTVAGGPNPQTGPFFVEGAEPGDLLVVTIEKLEPNRDSGTSAAMVTGSAVEPGSLSSRGGNSRVPWTIDAARRVVRFDLQAAGRTSWRSRFDAPAFEMPLAPSLASIGVAPAGADACDDDGRAVWRKHERRGHRRRRE